MLDEENYPDLSGCYLLESTGVGVHTDLHLLEQHADCGCYVTRLLLVEGQQEGDEDRAHGHAPQQLQQGTVQRHVARHVQN